MNNQERAIVGELWLETAILYGREISKQTLNLMLNAISDLDFKNVEIFMSDWIKHKKNKSFPLPADIRDFIYPEIDDDASAKESASRLMASVSKFGYTQPKEAKEYMGEAAWSIVSRYGGWTTICEQLGVELDRQVFQAQVRDLIKSHMSFSRMGIIDYKPALPEASKKRDLMPAGEIISLISFKNN